jgi:colicin import membrane protein
MRSKKLKNEPEQLAVNFFNKNKIASDMKSTIKYLLVSILTTALLLCFSSNTFAQQGKGQDKDKSEKKEKQEKQEHAKQDQSKPDKAPKDADQDKGKAPGDKGQAKDDKTDAMKKEQPEDAREGKDKKEKEEKDNKGNAYGKDKGDLSGREFGQQRAAEARSKHQTKKADTKTAIEHGDATVSNARERIKKAKENLEKDKKAKKINEKQYAERKKKIEDAEQQTNELENKVKTGKMKVEGQ